ncbi:hypothetical protein BJ742DRAFT_66754 [Cladochytrium replicatum]|nr:hypothetical protein BJ742DRAFT_66754 [Cladochytrium replicatum]
MSRSTTSSSTRNRLRNLDLNSLPSSSLSFQTPLNLRTRPRSSGIFAPLPFASPALSPVLQKKPRPIRTAHKHPHHSDENAHHHGDDDDLFDDPFGFSLAEHRLSLSVSAVSSASRRLSKPPVVDVRPSTPPSLANPPTHQPPQASTSASPSPHPPRSRPHNNNNNPPTSPSSQTSSSSSSLPPVGTIEPTRPADVATTTTTTTSTVPPQPSSPLTAIPLPSPQDHRRALRPRKQQQQQPRPRQQPQGSPKAARRVARSKGKTEAEGGPVLATTRSRAKRARAEDGVEVDGKVRPVAGKRGAASAANAAAAVAVRPRRGAAGKKSMESQVDAKKSVRTTRGVGSGEGRKKRAKVREPVDEDEDESEVDSDEKRRKYFEEIDNFVLAEE